MKYFLLAATFSCVFLHAPVFAQQENWDTYIAKFGDRPGSVLVDMALMPTAPDKRYPYLLVTGPTATKCGKAGFPDKDEIPALEDILNASGSFITGVTARVLAGTFTYNCKRLNYYYIKDTMGVRTALQRMYNRSYPNYSFTITIRPDQEWTEYRAFLYPSDVTLNWMENNMLLNKLGDDGENLKGPRTIVFDLFFRADTSRGVVSSYARGRGYEVSETTNTKTTNAPYELQVSATLKPTQDTVTAISGELKKQAAGHHGYYNGWLLKK